MARDFNLLFDSKFYAQGGNPTLKKKCSAKLIDFKEFYELFDIWSMKQEIERVHLYIKTFSRFHPT